MVVRPAPWLGGPYWSDADVDPDQHVLVHVLSGSAGDQELLSALEELRRQPFDGDRPHWQMWFLLGLAQGRVALYLKLHHSIADGVAGVALLGAFLDMEQSGDQPAPETVRSPRSAPSDSELLRDVVRRTLDDTSSALARLTHPRKLGRSMLATWHNVRNLGLGRAPVTSLNQPISKQRRFALARGDFESTRTVAHAYGATVNDVLLTAIAGGQDDLLTSRGEATDGLVLAAFVPVSLHQEESQGAEGNKSGAMYVPLALGIRDPIGRLKHIAQRTVEAKRHVYVPPSGRLARNRIVQRAIWRRFDQQRWANVYVANVPGPPLWLSFAGSQLISLFPVVPLTGNLTLAVALLSYAGQLNIAAVADASACPDLQVFIQGFRRTLQEMGIPTTEGTQGSPA